MGASWRVYAVASIVMFLLMLVTLTVFGWSSQIVELTDERVLCYAYVSGEGVVLVGTDDGIYAYRLDGSRAWSVTGDRACAAAASPSGDYVAAYVGMEVLLIRAGDGEVLKRFNVGTLCVEGAELSWGPGGDAVAGVSGMGRIIAVNVSDGYAAHSDWLDYEVDFIGWVNETHAVAAVRGRNGVEALVFRVEPFTIEERKEIGSRYWVVDGGVVSLGGEGDVMKWVPGEGVAWETGLGSDVMAADMGEGLLFVLTKDFRVVAINTDEGSVSWSVSLGCELTPNHYINRFEGEFEARGKAVGVSGIILGEKGICIVNGIFTDGRNVLEDASLKGAELEGWLSEDAALIRVGDTSAIFYLSTATAKSLEALYSYVAPMPYGAIVARHERIADKPPTYTTTYEYLAPDGNRQPIPKIGCCHLVGLTPTRALIIREKGAALLIIGPANPTTNLMISVPLLLAGTVLALLAYREWRIENRATASPPEEGGSP